MQSETIDLDVPEITEPLLNHLLLLLVEFAGIVIHDFLKGKCDQSLERVKATLQPMFRLLAEFLG
jgi:hypothetical protein